MRKKNPIAVLKTLFPWPEERPDVPLRRERWFNTRKQVLLRRVVSRDSKLVVELGSWVGDSTQWFLTHCPKAVVIAVDTWLGSCEHLVKRRALLPILYETFLANCWEYRDRLIPFRNTSLTALSYLSKLGLKPDVIYFDSDHSYWGLTAELEMACELFPGTEFLGDDYSGGKIAKTLEDCLHRQYRSVLYDRSKEPLFSRVEDLNDTWHLVKV